MASTGSTLQRSVRPQMGFVKHCGKRWISSVSGAAVKTGKGMKNMGVWVTLKKLWGLIDLPGLPLLKMVIIHDGNWSLMWFLMGFH